MILSVCKCQLKDEHSSRLFVLNLHLFEQGHNTHSHTHSCGADQARDTHLYSHKR